MRALTLTPLEKKQKRRVASFNEFGKADASAGTKRLLEWESINCECKNGALLAGIGIQTYKKDGRVIPAKENASRFFILDGGETLDAAPTSVFFCLTTSGDLYRFDERAGEYTYQLTASPYSQTACLADETGTKSWIVSNDDGYFAYEGGEWRGFELAGATTATCVCKGRVFIGLKKATIAYSDPSYPYHFTKLAGGGKIRLDYDFGEIVATISFENKVYVFHQYGVASVDVTGEAETFKIQPLDYVGGEIYGSSVAVCGKVIFFLALDGVYRFDGAKFERVEGVGTIAPWGNDKLCRVAVFGNRYLLQYAAADGRWRAVAIAADGKSGYFMSARQALSYSGGVALCQSGNYVRAFSEDGDSLLAEKRTFTTQKTDFGARGRKTLLSVRVRGRGLADMRIGTDGFEKEYELDFRNGVASVDVRVLGESFYFSFSLGENACIQEVTVDFSVAKGG